jgi:hypothetical protein
MVVRRFAARSIIRLASAAGLAQKIQRMVAVIVLTITLSTQQIAGIVTIVVTRLAGSVRKPAIMASMIMETV